MLILLLRAGTCALNASALLVQVACHQAAPWQGLLSASRQHRRDTARGALPGGLLWRVHPYWSAAVVLALLAIMHPQRSLLLSDLDIAACHLVRGMEL